MRIQIPVFSAFCLLVWLAGAAPVAAQLLPGADKSLVDSIVASIDGEPITMNELRRHAESQGFAAQPGFPSPSALTLESPQTAEVLRDLVLSRLLDKEADAIGISVGNDEIEAYIAEIQRQNNVDRAEFILLLQSRGIPWDKYVDQIRNDILKSRVISARVRSKVNVVDEDISAYFEERPELMPEKGAVRIQQIRFDVQNAEAAAAVQQKAAKVRKEVMATPTEKRAAAFAALGGESFQDLGHLNPKELRREIRMAIKPLSPGDVSAPVAIADGMYVFYLVAKVGKESTVDPLLEKEIRDQIFQAKFQEQLKQFLDEDLPKRYHVEFKL